MRPINMENRRTKRHTINVTAYLLCDKQSHPAEVIDISEGGAKIRLAGSTLTAGTTVQIDLPFLNELSASVAWANGTHCGLRFNDDQDRLNEFLYNLAIYGASHL